MRASRHHSVWNIGILCSFTDPPFGRRFKMTTTGTADNCNKLFIVRAFHLWHKPIIQFRVRHALVKSPKQIPAGSSQVVLVVHSDHVLRQMPRSTIQQRIQRDALINIVFAVFQCAFFAVLADLHDAIPRQKIHPPLSCMHIALGTGFKFGAVARVLNHCSLPPAFSSG